MNLDQGFQFGTQVLQETGKRLKNCIRNIDMVARIGADEFFVLLVETDLAGADSSPSACATPSRSNPTRATSLAASSRPASAWPGGAELSEAKMSDLIHSASEALRSAKVAGPDKIEVYSFA